MEERNGSRNGMEWNGMEWINGMEWNGMEWNGRNGMDGSNEWNETIWFMWILPINFGNIGCRCSCDSQQWHGLLFCRNSFSKIYHCMSVGLSVVCKDEAQAKAVWSPGSISAAFTQAHLRNGVFTVADTVMSQWRDALFNEWVPVSAWCAIVSKTCSQTGDNMEAKLPGRSLEYNHQAKNRYVRSHTGLTPGVAKQRIIKDFASHAWSLLVVISVAGLEPPAISTISMPWQKCWKGLTLKCAIK